MEPFVLIGCGGLLGANARYLLSRWAARRFGVAFPYGTFLINTSGCFLIGLVLAVIGDAAGVHADARFLVVTGFLGGYTTFSTFSFETVALLQNGDTRAAVVNALGSVLAGMTGVGGGMLLGTLIGNLTG